MLLPLLVTPPHPVLAHRQSQRRRGEPQRPQPALSRTHQVAHLGPGEDGHPLAVLALDERVPDGPLAGPVHALDRQFPHLLQPRRQVLGQAYARDQAIGLAAPRNTLLRARQYDALRAPGQHVESLQATRQLPAAQRIPKTKLRADATAQRPATRKLLARQNAGDPVDRLGTAQGALDLRLRPHSVLSSTIAWLLFSLGCRPWTRSVPGGGAPRDPSSRCRLDS